MYRKTFILQSLSVLIVLFAVPPQTVYARLAFEKEKNKPMVVSTCSHSLKANMEAGSVISENGGASDVAEKGVSESALDPDVPTVGYESYPDRDG